MEINPRYKARSNVHHFGFKRPVFFDPPKTEPEKQIKETEDKQSDTSKPIGIANLPFSLSFELLAMSDDLIIDPTFDWLKDDEDNNFDLPFNDIEMPLEGSRIFNSSAELGYKEDIVF